MQPTKPQTVLIGAAAHRAGLHEQTLRAYERAGLLVPARSAGNTRRYTDADVIRAQLIARHTSEFGLSLAAVGVALDSHGLTTNEPAATAA